MSTLRLTSGLVVTIKNYKLSHSVIKLCDNSNSDRQTQFLKEGSLWPEPPVIAQSPTC